MARIANPLIREFKSHPVLQQSVCGVIGSRAGFRFQSFGVGVRVPPDAPIKGSVAERPIALVLKTRGSKGSVSSNLTASTNMLL